MKIIAHRGNLDGRNPFEENRPEYIDKAIEEGFDVEIDIRSEDHNFYLGHDDPQYQVSMLWLYQRKDKLWIHCKDFRSMEVLSNSPVDFNYFWHESDRYTLTSNGIGWVYPGQQPYEKSVVVLPEDTLYFDEEYVKNNKFYALCTDFCYRYKDWDFLGS